MANWRRQQKRLGKITKSVADLYTQAWEVQFGKWGAGMAWERRPFRRNLRRMVRGTVRLQRRLGKVLSLLKRLSGPSFEKWGNED